MNLKFSCSSSCTIGARPFAEVNCFREKYFRYDWMEWEIESRILWTKSKGIIPWCFNFEKVPLFSKMSNFSSGRETSVVSFIDFFQKWDRSCLQIPIFTPPFGRRDYTVLVSWNMFTSCSLSCSVDNRPLEIGQSRHCDKDDSLLP
jgi:hypothetical protein